MGKAKRRAKGTGCVFLRRGVWYARWTHGGITKTESTGIRADEKGAKARAEAWLMDRTEPLRLRHRADALELIARQIMSVEERIAEDAARMQGCATLGDLERMFRESPRRPDCSADMLEFYCGVLRRFAAFAGPGTPVAEAGGEAAERYARELARSAAASTYNKAMNALALVWRVCGREAGLSAGENPWAEMARRRSDAHVRRPFTREETDRIVAAAEGETRALVAVLLYTGLRLGDACRVKWTDFRDGVAYVLTAKRDRKVAIPLHPKLAEALGRPKAQGYVMPGIAARYAMRQGSSNVSRSVKRLIERCGIVTSVAPTCGRKRPDATAHSFRHTFVTRAIEAGVPPHVVQQIVGHASATMTERYTHLSDEAVLAAFRKMDG